MCRPLAFLIGGVCLGIGLGDIVFGLSWIPDAGDYSAGLDGHMRFLGAIFAGYGLIWVWAARQEPVATRAVRFLAAVMFVGGIGRSAAIVVHGWPHPFYLGLAVVEIVLPPCVLVAASAYERGRPELSTAP